MRKVIILATLLTSVIFWTSAFAATYYVDSSATGSGNGLSTENAFATIQGAFDNINLEAGDIVEVTGGTYYERVLPGEDDQGSSAAQLLLKCKTGDVCTIDGSDQRSNGIVISGLDYFTIDGFNFRNITAQSIYNASSGTGNVVKNCNIEQDLAAASNTQDGITWIGQRNGLIQGNTIYHSGQINSVYAADSMKVTGGSGNIVEYNKITHYSTSTERHNDGIQMWNEANFTVRYNVIRHGISNGRMQAIYLEGVSAQNYGWWKIYGNLVYGPAFQTNAFSIRPKVATAIVHCYNNTVVITGTSGNPYMVEGSNNGTDGTTLRFKNNVALYPNRSTTAATIDDNPTPVNINHNLYFSDSTQIVYDSVRRYTLAERRQLGYDLQSLNVNPSLSSNFEPDSANDPVVNAGTELDSEYRYDMYGNVRGSDGYWDIGAFEYTGESNGGVVIPPEEDPPSTTLANPTGLIAYPIGIVVSSVSASSDDGNVPINTLDSDISSRWSSYGNGEWIQYDFGSQKSVSKALIGFFAGDQRIANFSIEVSSDGSNFSEVYSGNSSGNTILQEKFNFTSTVSARYVRIIGQGNTSNDWNSITEVDFF